MVRSFTVSTAVDVSEVAPSAEMLGAIIHFVVPVVENLDSGHVVWEATCSFVLLPAVLLTIYRWALFLTEEQQNKTNERCIGDSATFPGVSEVPYTYINPPLSLSLSFFLLPLSLLLQKLERMISFQAQNFAR